MHNLKIFFGVFVIITILVLVLHLILDKGQCGCNKENFEDLGKTMPIPSTGVIPSGYYQIDDKTISALPYNDYTTPLPKDISKIPHGYYIVQKTDPNANNKNAATIAKVPYGFAADANFNLIPLTDAAIADLYPIDDKNGRSNQKYVKPTVVSDPISDKDLRARMFTEQWKNPDKIASPLTDKFATDYSKNLTYDFDKSKQNYSPNVDAEHSEYHNDPSLGITSSGTPFQQYMVIDPSGNEIMVDYTPVQGDVTYYKPGSYLYGSSTYVPTYAESIYLSTSNFTDSYPKFNNTVSNGPEVKGFCNTLKLKPTDLEMKCNSLDAATCSTTSCCVLLGGQKCVSGDSAGPTMQSNYSDIFVVNKDVYYYQGECYGNCDK